MSEDRFDYGETICEAIDTIVSKKLEGLSYDITKICIIVDDTYKKQGRYTVADGALKFEAYSTITSLNINDNVLVNIPYGNYSMQKTILNKIIYNEENADLNYISPLDNMLKFTDNIINGLNSSEILTENGFGILANNKDVLLKTIYSFNSWENYANYDRMGVSVDFQTRLNQYNITEGNYGIKFLFYTTNNNVIELDFGINDMNGNPYHFDVFFNQTKLFDISKIKDVKSVDICLYQSNNFKNEDGLIPYEVTGDPILGIPDKKMDDNIFIKNLEIYLGYPLSDFDGDSVKIAPASGYASYNKLETETDTQHKGKKFLILRWVHQEENNKYISMTNNDIEKYKIQIYWFKYTLNQSRNEYIDIAGGPNWSTSGIDQSYNGDFFQSSFQPDYNKAQERIMAVCGIPNEFGNYEYFRSDILTFDNERATIDSLTYDVATQLSIECQDGSEGNYFIYNQSGKIINEGQGQGFERKFEAKFRGLSLDEPGTGLNEITSITWSIPTDDTNKQTMLTYNNSYWAGADSPQPTPGSGFRTITRKLSQQGLDYTQSYSIKNNWHSSNSSNLVKCEIIADGLIYEAILDLQFGKAGTSGTNITLVLEFNNNENALIYKYGITTKCSVKATMYDMAGAKISNPDGTWKWDWLHKSKDITIEKTENSAIINLTLSKDLGIIDLTDNYNILAATFTPANGGTPITSYLPIPIKVEGYDYIEGAREVIYNSQGIPEYYTDAYVLYGFYNNNHQTEIPFNLIKWELTQPNSENTYKLNLKKLNKNGAQYFALLASPFYIKNYNDRACVCAVSLNNNEVVWSQPILIMQSQYDYATLNDWNGSVDVGDKTIMSAMLGAGKKDENNLFSGVIIGDIELASNNTPVEGDEETTGIGLYGLSDGVISFSLTEAGVATFGKINPQDNQGQVVLGGKSNTITDANGHYFINIDDGYNSIIHGNGKERLLIGGDADKPTSYLSLTDVSNKTILNFAKDKYLIQSSNFAAGTSGLQIDLNNGKIEISNTSNKLTIDSKSSNAALTIGNLSINWSGALTSNSNSINLASSGNVISIGSDFKVTADGSVYYKGTELTAYINSLISAANN